MKRIGTKLALQIALVIVVVMTTFGILDIYRRKSQFTNFLERKEESSLQQLSLILGELLFNMNLEQMEHVVESYLIDAEILSIKVTEKEDIMSYSGKDPDTKELLDFTQEESQPPHYPDAVMRQVPLIYEEQELGMLEIVFSRQFVQMQVRKTIITLSERLLVVILIECLVVLTLVRRNISIPLINLVQAARQIAEGDIDIHLPKIFSRNEIGTLTAAFETMMTYIQHMAGVATSISTGELHHKVNPRSEKDILGQAYLTMTAYLNEIATVATAIAAGDLRQVVQPRTESDVLGKAFQQMEYLRQSLSEIMSGTTQLRSASETLDKISTEMASATEQTSRQTAFISSSSSQISQNVDAAAVASEELSANIREISKNATEIAQVAITAVEKATSANTTIIELETRTQTIGSMIKVITDVTQQTNLLALNATIEAARAGEAGKGFTVVAGEIKELSQETAASAEDIIRNLEAIRTLSQDVTTANNEITRVIEQIRELSGTIAYGIEEQSVTTNNIAHRMTEAAQESKHITQAIRDVAATAQHTSEGASNVQNASKDLAALADQLQQLVGRFKI